MASRRKVAVNPLDRRGGIHVVNETGEPQDLHQLRALVDSKVTALEKDIMRLTFVVGEDSGDGLQKEVLEIKEHLAVLKTAIHTLEKWGNDTINEYWHTRRPMECLGLEAVKEMKAQLEKAESMNIDVMKIATDVAASKRSGVVTIIVAVIGFLAMYFKP